MYHNWLNKSEGWGLSNCPKNILKIGIESRKNEEISKFLKRFKNNVHEIRV